MAAANVEFEQACKTLGIDTRHASVNSINKAYRALAKKYHPDKNPGIDHGLFVRITDAKNTALKHVKNSSRSPAQPAKPLKIEVAPGELEFTDVGRRETKSRDFIIYSTGGPFTKFTIDRRHLPRWIHISGITRTTGEDLPVRVSVRVTGPELGGHYECHIPVKIENKHTGCWEESTASIRLIMKAPKLQVASKSFVFSAGQGSRPGPQILTLKNAGAGQIKGDLHSPQPWIVTQPSRVSFHDRQQVKITIDDSKLAGSSSGQLTVRTNAGEETVSVQATVAARAVPMHGPVNTANPPDASRKPVKAGGLPKGGKAGGGKAPGKTNIASPAGQPLQTAKKWGVGGLDSRKAALAVAATAGGLFLFAGICIINTPAPDGYAGTITQQETGQAEQPGQIQSEETGVAALPVQSADNQAAPLSTPPETPGQDEAVVTPVTNVPAAAVSNRWRSAATQGWSSGYTGSDNSSGSSSYPPPPPVSPNVTQQDGSANTDSGNSDAEPGPHDQAKKKDGKIRRPFPYLEGLRDRFDSLMHTGRFHRDGTANN